MNPLSHSKMRFRPTKGNLLQEKSVLICVTWNQIQRLSNQRGTGPPFKTWELGLSYHLTKIFGAHFPGTAQVGHVPWMVLSITSKVQGHDPGSGLLNTILKSRTHWRPRRIWRLLFASLSWIQMKAETTPFQIPGLLPNGNVIQL